jgi:hypothetical protein
MNEEMDAGREGMKQLNNQNRNRESSTRAKLQ